MTSPGETQRLPAHFAGVCGHKPSFGLVPALGYIDHVTAGATEPDINVLGPLARHVDDLETVFDVIAGPAGADASAWSLDLPPTRHTHISDIRFTEGRSGQLAFVTVRHELSAEGALCIADEHDIVYREAARPESKPNPGEAATSSGRHTWAVRLDSRST